MKKLGILFGLKIDEGRKLQDLYVSFAKKLRILSLQEDQCRKISKMLIRKADFNVLGQLDDSTLQWFVFVNSLYYEFDWASLTENSFFILLIRRYEKICIPKFFSIIVTFVEIL